MEERKPVRALRVLLSKMIVMTGPCAFVELSGAVKSMDTTRAVVAVAGRGVIIPVTEAWDQRD